MIAEEHEALSRASADELRLAQAELADIMDHCESPLVRALCAVQRARCEAHAALELVHDQRRVYAVGLEEIGAGIRRLEHDAFNEGAAGLTLEAAVMLREAMSHDAE